MVMILMMNPTKNDITEPIYRRSQSATVALRYFTSGREFMSQTRIGMNPSVMNI